MQPLNDTTAGGKQNGPRVSCIVAANQGDPEGVGQKGPALMATVQSLILHCQHDAWAGQTWICEKKIKIQDYLLDRINLTNFFQLTAVQTYQTLFTPR